MIGADSDLVALRKRSREFDRSCGCIRSVLGEFDHVSCTDHVEKCFGTLKFDNRGPAIIKPQRELSADRFDNGWICMSKRNGSQAHSVLDVFVVVHVPDATTLPASDVRSHSLRKLIVSFCIRMSATRYHRVEALSQFI